MSDSKYIITLAIVVIIREVVLSVRGLERRAIIIIINIITIIIIIIREVVRERAGAQSQLHISRVNRFISGRVS